jgi:hypothetical protein
MMQQVNIRLACDTGVHCLPVLPSRTREALQGCRIKILPRNAIQRFAGRYCVLERHAAQQHDEHPTLHAVRHSATLA